MLKKIILGTLLVGFIGVLVAFAVIRTVNRTANVAEARGLGEGRGAGQGARAETLGTGLNLGTDAVANGGGRYGQGASTAERQYPNYEEAPAEWNVYEGTVVQAPAAGVDLIITTGDGEELVIGTGPGYLEDQGLALQLGESVQVRGYWNDGEFKAAQVTRLRDGETITLRDEVGRPAWAGGGRFAQAEARDADDDLSSLPPRDGTATGQAVVEEWLTLPGTVVSVDDDALVVQTADGQEIVVQNRAWWFAQDQGFSAKAGDEVTCVGFYDGEVFEVGQIDNVTSGQTVFLRETSGRPLWAGRGRRGA
jgi:hypothetical protein